MKKITWLFLSMMLFLGFGVAFADGETEGEGSTTPVALAKPTFSHPTNTTLIWGTQVTLSTTDTGKDVSIHYKLGAAPADPTLTSKGLKYTRPIAINKAQTIKAVTIKGEGDTARISEVETATYKVKLSETTLAPATGATIKQGSEIACTIPAELTSNSDKYIYLLYVEGDDTETVLETDGDILERLDQAVGMAAQGMQVRYPNLGTDYKVAVYSPDYESWIFPITAPEQDGTFKIRARAVIDGSTSGDLVYGDEMTATYTVSGEANAPEGIGLPVFSVEEGAVDAGTELRLTPTNADEVIYVIDDEDVELTYDNFTRFKCFMYTESAPIKIYKGQTIRAVSAKILTVSEKDVTMEYSDVKTVTYTVNGGDQPDKKPTLTVTPEVLKVAQGDSVMFSCTMDPQNYAEKIGFAFRAKIATTKDIKLKYRLDETSDWTEYTEPVLADLYNANPIAAIPNNEYVVDARVCDNTKGPRTVYYCLTVPSITPPVMAVELGYVNAQGKYITLTPDANNYAPLARIPLNIEVYPAAPRFSVEAGEVEKGTKVKITCITGGAKIYYTVDGSEPTVGSTVYTDSVEITETTTLKAFAVLGQRESSVTTAVYTIKGEDPVVEEKDTLPMPTFNPVGGEVEKGTAVVLSCDTANAKIYYTVNGEIPTVESIEYTAAISIDSAMTIKAIAVKDGFVNSPMAEAAYTIKGENPVVEEKDTLPMPNFNPVGGEVEKGTAVVLSCDTANAKIYYSINADTVTVNSLEYTTAISIDSAMTIKAIAVKDGFVNSPMAEASYTIKEGLANEGKELAGVSVYPNPNSGMFYIELPVEATVEVFASNGVLVRSFTAQAGKATLSLDHSGIYFIRVASEGRATVKRVIVR